MKLLKLSFGAAALSTVATLAACSAPESQESDDDNGNPSCAPNCPPGAGGSGQGAAPGAGGGFTGTGSVPGTGGSGVPGAGGSVVGAGGSVVGAGGSVVGAGGSVVGAGGGAGAAPGAGGGGTSGPLGGYHVHGDWAGFAFAFATEATIMPMSFDDMITEDGPYCVSGTVSATEEYTSIAAFGVNTNQDKIEDAAVMKMSPDGTGIMVDLKINIPDHATLRIQLEDGEEEPDSTMPQHRWCSNLPAADGPIVLPWDSFNTQCWSAEAGTNFDPSVDQIAKVIIYVPDPGPMGSDTPFDFCVNDIGPDDVTSRGEGAIVADCGTNVSWGKTSTNAAFENIATSDNRYQFQTNGWNLMGGGHSFSLLGSNGFRMESQTCDSQDSAPCSFPSIYIGTDADGERTSGGGLPKAINQIQSAPTCLGWSSGGTPIDDEYNVSYDVWFNPDPNANYASSFLMVWLRDPPSFQPGGMFPVQNGVVIGDQTWALWYGPNADGAPVTSYVAPNARADGQAYSFDLKDFIDDAVERGYLDPSHNLIAVMGGMEIWGGAQGASISSFSATVN